MKAKADTNIVSKVIYVSVCFFVVSWAALMVGIDSHERVHVKIFEAEGCKNITYELDYLGVSGVTKCHEYGAIKNISKADELNLMNEVVGYNLTGVIIAMLCGFFMVSLTMLLCNDR